MTASRRVSSRARPAAGGERKPGPAPPATPASAGERAVLWAMVAAWAVTYTALGALRYRWYLYTDFDLAIFTQALSGILRGSLFGSIRGMAWPGDHSSLVLFLLAPVYALARHPVTLLAIQAGALALGAVPVHALARRELRDGRLALACAALYLLQPAMGYAALFEFHPEMLATPALVAAFAALRGQRAGAALAFTGFALLCREDVALVAFALAVYAAIGPGPRNPRLAAGLAVAGLASVAVTWGFLRPAFSHGEADYAGVYRQWGDGLGGAVAGMARDPLRALASLVSTPGNPRDSLIKLQYHAALLLPLGLLPLLSPATLALALPAMAEHLLSWRTAQHTVLCQYTALVLPFTACAAVMGMRNLLAWLAPESRGGAAVVRVRTGLLGAALVASVGCAAWFGPLTSSGKFFLTPTRGRHLPTGAERASARAHDRMLPRIPRRGAVVASFESLARLASRDSVHSIHHLLSGTYTFSPRPYPVPAGVTAVLADFGAPNVLGNLDASSALRMAELIERNHLAPADAAGDLVLFLREPAQPLALVTLGACEHPAAVPVVFDRELAFDGGALASGVARAGEVLPLRTCWRRVADVDRLFTLELALVDASGAERATARHPLGYGFLPPHAWPAAAGVREEYRLVLPDDLPAGEYRVLARVAFRGAGGEGYSEPDRPQPYAGTGGIELGRARITSR